MKLKVAIFLEKFSPTLGGAERYTFELCQQLVREGVEIHVMAEEWTEKLRGVQFHHLKVASFPRALHILKFAGLTRKLLKKKTL